MKPWTRRTLTALVTLLRQARKALATAETVLMVTELAVNKLLATTLTVPERLARRARAKAASAILPRASSSRKRRRANSPPTAKLLLLALTASLPLRLRRAKTP